MQGLLAHELAADGSQASQSNRLAGPGPGTTRDDVGDGRDHPVSGTFFDSLGPCFVVLRDVHCRVTLVTSDRKPKRAKIVRGDSAYRPDRVRVRQVMTPSRPSALSSAARTVL
ncbi:MAG: hypothetical protein ACR2JQ_00895, partial [Mycobacteriales bacterium]